MDIELKEVPGMIQKMESNIEEVIKKVNTGTEAGAKALALAEEAKTELAQLKEKGATGEELKAHGEKFEQKFTELRKDFDELATLIGRKGGGVQISERKSLSSAIMDGVKGFFPEFDPNPIGLGAAIAEQPQGKLLKMFANDRQAKFSIPLAANTVLPTSAELDIMEQKTMTLNANLTGPAFASQDPRMAIFPSQKINARELLPTYQTDTGYYVYWKEDAGETNNIAFQVEGSDKPENNYSLTGSGIVENFMSGVTTFSKQFVNSLPFMTQYLPVMLMRDFFKKENAYAYSVMASGTGDNNITTSTDNVIRIIRYIAKQLKYNYNASFVIVDTDTYGTLIESTYTKGYYPGAGTVTYSGTSLQIDGVPIIRATWATANTCVIIDRDFIQRVQVSGLAIELSYENDKNFTKNLITARIECQEEFVLQLAPSAIYGTMQAPA